MLSTSFLARAKCTPIRYRQTHSPQTGNTIPVWRSRAISSVLGHQQLVQYPRRYEGGRGAVGGQEHLPEVVPSEYNSGPQVQYGNDKEQWNQYTAGFADGSYQSINGHTPPPPPFEQNASDSAPVPWWKRRRILWAGAITVVVVIIVAVVVGVVVGRRSGGNDNQPSKSESSPSTTSTPTQSTGTPSSAIHPFSEPTTLSDSLPPPSCQQDMCTNMLASATLGSSQDRFIFSRGADGAIWYRRADADGWATEWESLGGSFISPPTIVSINSNQLDVFAIWENQEVRVKSMQAGTWDRDWLNLSGRCSSQPASTSFGSDRLSMVCASNEREAGLKYYRPHRWGPSVTGWQGLGGWLSGAPALASGAEEYVSAVAYGFTNWSIGDASQRPETRMMYLHFNTSHWVGWEGEWGQFKGDPAVVAVTATQSEYFGVDVNGTMWHNSYSPRRSAVRSTTMHGIVGDLDLRGLSLDYTVPENLGGNFASTPFAWATGLERVDVVAVDGDGRLKHRARISGEWAEEWEDLGGWFDSAPVVWAPTNLKDEELHVFGLGSDGDVIHGTFSVGEGHEFGEGSWFTDGGEMTATPYRLGV